MADTIRVDVWMPIYIGDYLADTIGLTHAEHGAYLLAMFAYWRKGGALTESELRAICLEQCTSIARYFRLHDGHHHHKRIDSELAMAKLRQNTASDRAKKAADARWMHKPCSSNAQAMLEHTSSPSPSPSVPSGALSPSVPPREAEAASAPSRLRNANPPSAERPSEAEVLAHADTIGLAAWKTTDWWREMEACGWLDHQHRPVVAWKPILARVKAKWEADGRPTGPPKGKYGNNTIENNPRLTHVDRSGTNYAEAIKRKIQCDSAAAQLRAEQEAPGPGT
jgi:uncharacterized protein YdaU (DUF1376 family)